MDVNVSIGVDLSDLERALTDAESKVMQKHRAKMVSAIKDQMWRGWKYKGRDPDSTGRSRRAWKGYEQTTEGTRSIIIENEARGFYSGKGYAAYVKRRKGAKPEAEIVLENLLQLHLPDLIEELTAEIDHSLNTESPPKRVRKNKTSTYKPMSLKG
jgi:hypothetical protein